jgi:NAD(P)-dependent dehydrogenase (short-subunit alcohol dehydrogenase family)
MTRSVVVTGASSGIGEATALELAAAGYDVIGTTRTAEKAAALRNAATEHGVTVETVVLDVADPESTVRGFTQIANLTDGGPWAVVNNAGVAQPGAVEDVDDDQARLQLETNLMAPARIARLVLPAMRQRHDGRIVNISSMSGRVSTPFLGWYCASKHALESLTDALRIEVAHFGVKVILVEPGSFGTGIWERGVAALPPERSSAYRDCYPLAGELLRRSRGLPGPAPVARAVRAALDASRPRARYLVGRDARAGTALEAVLPTQVTDYAKEVASGLRTPPRRLGRLLRGMSRRPSDTLDR